LAEREKISDLELDDDEPFRSVEPGRNHPDGAPPEKRRFAYPPSLVVVDGGPPQVSAARHALDELGVTDVALCGLAKRLEEVWLPDSAFPVILERTSEALYLLQRVRDEAHRFAITAHRRRRSAGMTASVLDNIPGLGPARIKELIKHFGSLKRLRAASVEEIASVRGMGPTTAHAVVAALTESPADKGHAPANLSDPQNPGILSP
jgi:excinuclease ABC subunit C